MFGIYRFFAAVIVLALSACGNMNEKSGTPISRTDMPSPWSVTQEVELARAITQLGVLVDPEEAAMAARIAYEHTNELAIQYQITDSALVHNVKVNMGIKPRGLCKHWAQDMEKRFKAEDFQTLTIHRAIGALIGVDHSTVVISQRGDDIYKGIVVDPWRAGGRLTWVHTAVDTAWGWTPQYEVLDRLAARTALERGQRFMLYRAEGGDEQRCLVVNGGVDKAKSSTNLAPCMSARPSSGS